MRWEDAVIIAEQAVAIWLLIRHRRATVLLGTRLRADFAGLARRISGKGK